MKHIMNTPEAPSPIGPYNQAVKSGHLLYTSGQIPIDPATGDIARDAAGRLPFRFFFQLRSVDFRQQRHFPETHATDSRNRIHFFCHGIDVDIGHHSAGTG